MNLAALLAFGILCARAEEPIRACALLAPGAGTQEIQTALNRCSPAQAVVLSGGSFTAAPLILPRGVTLYIEEGATLNASRDPREYEIPPEGKGARYKPLIFAYQAAFSGVRGAGTIDGRGVARELVTSYESQGFRIEGVTLRNAMEIHAAIYKTTAPVIANVR